MITEFSLDLAIRLYESEEQFPVNLEVACEWLGFSRKDVAKRKLIKNFVEGEDYRVHQVAESAPQGGLTHYEDIWLTTNCLKELGMMAGTPKGKQIRKYFIQCEEIAKQAFKIIPQLQQQIQQLQQQVATLTEQIQPLLPADSSTPPPGWNPEIWNQLPPQDKRHFRYTWRRRRFRPSHQGNDEVKALPISTEAIKQKQRAEMERIVGEVSEEEKARVEAMKQEMFRRLDEAE
jgi:phage anti-repressor protein